MNAVKCLAVHELDDFKREREREGIEAQYECESCRRNWRGSLGRNKIVAV
mgnify:CR=1 FL=1